jgi:hypothetical protein
MTHRVLVESRMRGNVHVRFGGRERGNGAGETWSPRPLPTLLSMRPACAYAAPLARARREWLPTAAPAMLWAKWPSHASQPMRRPR